jgi:hypothetical protein
LWSWMVFTLQYQRYYLVSTLFCWNIEPIKWGRILSVMLREYIFYLGSLDLHSVSKWLVFGGGGL